MAVRFLFEFGGGAYRLIFLSEPDEDPDTSDEEGAGDDDTDDEDGF